MTFLDIVLKLPSPGAPPEETCKKGNTDLKVTGKEEESQRRISKKEEGQIKEVTQNKDVGGVKGEVKGADDAAKTKNKPACDCEGGGEKERKAKQKNWINKPKCSIINHSVKSTEGTETQDETENLPEKCKSTIFTEKLDKDPGTAEEDKSKACTEKHKKADSALRKVEVQISEISVECEYIRQSASECIGEEIEAEAIEVRCDTGQSEPDGQQGEATLATSKDGGGDGGGGGEGGASGHWASRHMTRGGRSLVRCPFLFIQNGHLTIELLWFLGGRRGWSEVYSSTFGIFSNLILLIFLSL